MSKQFEINQQIIKKDYGEIVLYQRSDHKAPKWQSRIKIRGSTGYVRKSTRTSDFESAVRIATEFYESIADNFRATGSTQVRTLKETVDEWLAQSTKSPSVIAEAKSRLYNYPVKFWNNTAVDRITDTDLDNFIDWRFSQGRKKEKPSKATVKRDLVPLKQVFAYAYKKNYIKRRLTFDKLTVHTKRRPEFSDKEWRKIIQVLPEWVEKAKKNKRHHRDRFYLKQYILILGNTGIRPGSESRSLTWKTIQFERFGNPPQEHLVITIPEGKVGPRKVIPHESDISFFNALKKFRTAELKDLNREFDEREPIFCHENGEAINTFSNGFRAFLNHYDLLFNVEGVARTPYSLRHTYATRMVRSGFNHWHLAKNMGTSVEHLENYYVHDDHSQYAREFLQFRAPAYVRPLPGLPDDFFN